METIQISDLPDDWRDTIIPVNLQKLGSAWVVRGQSSVLKVPSVVIPHEWNYVLNPAHPEFPELHGTLEPAFLSICDFLRK
jgi:RES domain-containing protein